MPLYLVEDYIGSGTHQDPWRPIDEAGWSAIKLGPGGPTARALVWLPTSSSDPRLRLLGDSKSEVPASATRAAVSARLGIDVSSTPTLAALVLAVLNVDDGRWRRLQPTWIPDIVQRRLLRWQLWLGGELWVDTPVVAGGATFSDTFSDNDANPLPSPWATSFGASAMQRVGGRARGTAVGSACSAYRSGYQSDQFCQATIFHTTGSTLAVLSLRAESADLRAYSALNDQGNNSRISESDAGGSPTTLATAAVMADGSVMRIEASGSTLSGYDDGVLTLGPVTDTTLTAGRIQIGVVCVAAVSDVELDAVTGGDLIAADVGRFPNRLRPGIFQPGIAR